jgi:GntR family transcriptional regulator
MISLPFETINRNSKIPYYQQLYAILRGKISRGEWKPGDMIPPESDLIEQYGVSRSTVRQVLDILVNEGLVYRERGRGSFVTHPTVEQTMTRIVSFTEDMRQRGFVPSTKVLSASLILAKGDIGEKLQVPEGEELARVERLRLADGEPMSIEESYLVHRYCPNVLQHDYATQPLRAARRLRHSPGQRQAGDPGHLRPRHLATYLEIKPAAPCSSSKGSPSPR